MDIAIGSGKGGTSKTTMAVNLASFIKNTIEKRNDEVVLVDLDVEVLNYSLYSSLMPSPSYL